MTTLTVNIDDQGTERKIRALLDKLGVNNSVSADSTLYKWWEDGWIVQELDRRSEGLKSDEDKGVSFTEVRQRISSQ